MSSWSQGEGPQPPSLPDRATSISSPAYIHGISRPSHHSSQKPQVVGPPSCCSGDPSICTPVPSSPSSSYSSSFCLRSLLLTLISPPLQMMFLKQTSANYGSGAKSSSHLFVDSLHAKTGSHILKWLRETCKSNRS